MKKKILSLIAAAAVTTTMMAPGVVASAATNSKSIQVSYDNQTVITDPDQPNNPQWQVVIPSSIAFADNKKVIDTDIELQTINGGSLNGLSIEVKVSSLNSYKLRLASGTEEAEYSLAYGNTVLNSNNSSEKVIATLADGNTKQTGKATLTDTAKATKSGQYTDTLTYTVENKGTRP